MATKINYVETVVRQKLEESVKQVKNDLIDKLTIEFKEKLTEIAAESVIDLQQFYDIQEDEKRIAITLVTGKN